CNVYTYVCIQVNVCVSLSLYDILYLSVSLCQLLSSEEPFLRVWSVSVPQLWTTPLGTSVRAVAAVKLTSGAEDVPGLYFETEVEVVVRTSYAEKKLTLNATAPQISIMKESLSKDTLQMVEAHIEYLTEAVEKIGVPKVISGEFCFHPILFSELRSPTGHTMHFQHGRIG
uniref:Uncharacterized protein n=1 Tax=Hucho hucho TaxID=62062 RepID=A0A4W5P2M5_9TELE